ncbi:lysozyme [Bradyrhizobium sp.]
MAQASSSPGLIICEESEGYARELPDGSVAAYWDTLGCVWTCGFGSTGLDVKSDTQWTREQAVESLLAGWNVARAGVLRASPCLADRANANRLEAITDFAYNEGVGRYQGSSLRSYVNRGNWQAAAAEFPKWNLAGGKVQPGLVTRRAKEQSLFSTRVSSSVPVHVPQSNAVSQSSLGRLLLAFFRSLFG